jgi:hypothetical protein
MRYKKRLLAVNKNELYSEHFEKRGVNYIDQYTTPVLNHATPSQIKKLNIVHHSWTYGDKYYKLAHEHYSDSELWWVIAWFNQKPTEAHVSVGDIIFVPKPVNEILKVYEMYY